MPYDTAILYDVENIGGASLKGILDALNRTNEVGQIVLCPDDNVPFWPD